MEQNESQPIADSLPFEVDVDSGDVMINGTAISAVGITTLLAKDLRTTVKQKGILGAASPSTANAVVSCPAFFDEKAVAALVEAVNQVSRTFTLYCRCLM